MHYYKLFAEFWDILAEQMEGITSSEAGEYVSQIAKLMSYAISGKNYTYEYDRSKFFRSVVSLLITVYVGIEVLNSTDYEYSPYENLVESVVADF